VQSPLVWRRARVMALRRWIARVDWTKLSRLWSSLLTKQAALNLGSLLRCRLVPALAILQFGLCDCSGLLGRPASSACWSEQSGALVLAVRSVAKGTSGVVRTANGAVVNWFLSSCGQDNAPCILEVGLLLRVPPNVRVATTTTTTRSTTLSSSASSTTPPAAMLEVEQVYDERQRQVGVAVSPILYLGMSSLLRGGVDVCLQPNEDLLAQNNCSSSSCVPAFGFATTASSRLTVASRVQVVIVEKKEVEIFGLKRKTKR
jgi:hypothetical protein